MGNYGRTYKASDVIKRAKQLADVANTDFVSYEEDLAYLNDAWTQLFNKIINKGDKQFVKEVELTSNGSFGMYTEYMLPTDLYQIVSLKDKVSGSLVERHAESQGINSGTYDIVNNRIRLYGVTYGNLVLTYWTVPKYLSFPKTPSEIDISIASNIISSAGNSVLLNDGKIINTKTKEQIGEIDMTSPSGDYYLGNGHVFHCHYNDGDYEYLDFDGNVIVNGSADAYGFDYLYNFYTYENGDWHFCGEAEDLPSVDNVTFAIFLEDNFLLFTADGKIYLNDTELESTEVFNNSNWIFPVGKFDDKDALVIDGKTLALVNDIGTDIAYASIDTKNKIRFYVVEDGIITLNGTSAMIESWLPDTLLNFPKEIYFSLLAAQLGLFYLAKQNADSAGLESVYENYWNIFMDSLSQASDYTRIKNVYGRGRL